MHAVIWLKAYIRHRWPVFVLYGLAAVVYPLLSYLYGEKPEANRYGDLLLAFFLLVFASLDFVVFFRKHRWLSTLVETPGVDCYELPAPSGLIEEDYQELLRELSRRADAALLKAKSGNDERMDYFTLWVHQIKTPISALDLLLQKEKSEGRAAEGMEQELFRICRYVDMVLEYLRLDSIDSDYAFRSCDLNPIMKALVRKYAPVFIHKKIAVKLEELPFPVVTDEKWISLIAEQLLSNALKYTETGGVHIYMEKNPLALVIEDTGIGIRKEDRQRIFERGFTGFNGRFKEKSTGLGLFLAKEAAGRLGCRLEVESEPGKGSRFRILMPRKEAEIFT